MSSMLSVFAMINFIYGVGLLYIFDILFSLVSGLFLAIKIPPDIII